MFTETVLTWYETHKRDLPWRNISDPYRIWVSEIILQQTRIVQGYDYYMRFIKAFPTITALANATEDEVLKLWQGLGYYSRARNMHAAAKQIVELGHFPNTYKEILKLKGVGEYTAAAISSFAYHLPHAVVDGNVYRVLSRYFGIKTPIDTPQGKRMFAELASELLPANNVADYNQALMDFGATQCTPSAPQCEECPLNNSCSALQTNEISVLPVKQHKVKVRQRYFVFIKIKVNGNVWIQRRNRNDIWKGLYQFHLQEYDNSPSMLDIQEDAFIKSLAAKGVWHALKLGIKHVLTHQVIYADFYECTVPFHLPTPQGYISVSEDEMSRYAFPQLFHKAKIL